MKNRRPYMIIMHEALPGEGAQTHLKNWQEKYDWNIRETVEFDVRVRDNILMSATVIIDVLKRKVVKNRFAEKGYNNDDIMDSYFTKYQDQLIKYLSDYLETYPDDTEVNKIVDGETELTASSQ